MMGYSSLVAILLFASGMIMLMLGMLGEYVGRIYVSLNSISQYTIRNTININDTEPDVSVHDKGKCKATGCRDLDNQDQKVYHKED